MPLLLLGLAVLVLGFLLRAAPATARAGGVPLLLAYLLPALLLGWAFWDPGHGSARLRFALLGLGFRSEGGKPVAAELSGDRTKADVYVSALREGGRGPRSVGRLEFAPAERGKAAGTLKVLASRGEAPGFLAVQPSGGRLAPLEALALAEGDTVKVAERSWRFTEKTRPFGPPARFDDGAGHAVELPRRESEIPLVKWKVPLGRPLPASQETFPLAYLEKAATKALPSPLPAAFLFHQAGGFFLAAPGSSAKLERAGREVPIPRQAALKTGDAVHVVSFPRWDEADFKAGGWRDRRSFRVEIGRRGFALEFDTPEVYSLPWRKGTGEKKKVGIEDLAIGASRPTAPERPEPPGTQAPPLRVALSLGDWSFADKSLHFGSASRKVAGEALATFELPRDPAASAGGLGAATPRGQSRSLFGRPIWLGGELLAAVQLDTVLLPFGFALFAGVLALLKAAAGRSVGLSNAHLLGAAALEALLAVRVLLGFRAWALAPFSEEAMRLAMIAWGFLPWVLIAAAHPAVAYEADPDDGPGPRDLLLSPMAGGLLFAAAWSWRWSGGGLKGLVWCGVALGLLALPILRGGWGRAPLTGAGRSLAGVGRRAAGAARRTLPRVAGAFSWGTSTTAALGRRLFGEALPWIGIAALPTLLRGWLFGTGAKEGLPLFGQRLALTLIHIPLAVVLQAAYLGWLWRRAERRGRLTLQDLAPAAAFLLFTWCVPAVLVSDLGLALLGVPVFGVAFLALVFAAAAKAREERGDDEVKGFRLARGLGVAVFGLFLLLTAFPAATRVLARGFSLFHAEEGVERNYLRILAFAYPEELGRIARRSSEELAVMNAVMESYTARPYRECRYLSSETSPHLRVTALREHATSVFLAAEWSVVGVLGVGLLYLAWAAAGLRLAPWHSDEADAGSSAWRDPAFFRLGAVLSGLTLAIPSLYMIFANYRLTLFTGKNVYLLGLDSMADVLESLLLVALFSFFAARAGEAEEAS